MGTTQLPRSQRFSQRLNPGTRRRQSSLAHTAIHARGDCVWHRATNLEWNTLGFRAYEHRRRQYKRVLDVSGTSESKRRTAAGWHTMDNCFLGCFRSVYRACLLLNHLLRQAIQIAVVVAATLMPESAVGASLFGRALTMHILLSRFELIACPVFLHDARECLRDAGFQVAFSLPY